jgi:hypothetical protein
MKEEHVVERRIHRRKEKAYVGEAYDIETHPSLYLDSSKRRELYSKYTLQSNSVLKGQFART